LFAGDRFILYRIERSQSAGTGKVVTAAGKNVK
jgi:hypothetical protein